MDLMCQYRSLQEERRDAVLLECFGNARCVREQQKIALRVHVCGGLKRGADIIGFRIRAQRAREQWGQTVIISKLKQCIPIGLVCGKRRTRDACGQEFQGRLLVSTACGRSVAPMTGAFWNSSHAWNVAVPSRLCAPMRSSHACPAARINASPAKA